MRIFYIYLKNIYVPLTVFFLSIQFTVISIFLEKNFYEKYKRPESCPSLTAQFHLALDWEVQRVRIIIIYTITIWLLFAKNRDCAGHCAWWRRRQQRRRHWWIVVHERIANDYDNKSELLDICIYVICMRQGTAKWTSLRVCIFWCWKKQEWVGVIEISVAKNLSFGNVQVNHLAQYVSGGFFLFLLLFWLPHAYLSLSLYRSLSLYISLSRSYSFYLPFSYRRYLSLSLVLYRLSVFTRSSVLSTE